MTAQGRQWRHVLFEQGRAEKPGRGKRGVEHPRAVALAHDKAVPVGQLGATRVDVQHGQEQDRNDISRREVPSNVPQTGSFDHLQVASTDRACRLAEEASPFLRRQARVDPAYG